MGNLLLRRNNFMGKQPVAKGAKKTKAQIAKAAASSGKGKKKWGAKRKGEQKVNTVFIEKKELKKIKSGICGMKIITVGKIINRYNITGSLARSLVRTLRESGQISLVGQHHAHMWIYQGAQAKAQ